MGYYIQDRFTSYKIRSKRDFLFQMIMKTLLKSVPASFSLVHLSNFSALNGVMLALQPPAPPCSLWGGFFAARFTLITGLNSPPSSSASFWFRESSTLFSSFCRCFINVDSTSALKATPRKVERFLRDDDRFWNIKLYDR